MPKESTVPIGIFIIRFILIPIAFLAFSHQDSLAQVDPEEDLSDVVLKNPRLIKTALINREWTLQKEKFRQFVRSSQSNTSVIYDAQMELSNFVQFAYQNNRSDWLVDVMSVYLEAYPALSWANTFTFYYPDGVTPRKVLPLSGVYPMWLTSDKEEDYLNSSQFLYPITLLLYWIIREDFQNKDPVALEFFQKYAPVALSHIRRWVLNSGSPAGAAYFQVRGWGCMAGTFDHREFIIRKKNKTLGTSYKYCNAVTDGDLFILMATMHLIRAQQISPASFNLSNTEKNELINYLYNGMDLIASRISYGTVYGSKHVMHFDLGAWDDHPDFRYSGDLNPSFPGYLTNSNTTPARSPKPASNVGWDISHARRLPLLFFTLREVGLPLGIIAENNLAYRETGFTNLMAYIVFNQNLSNPLFSNFIDGTNGWYRVNYSNRPNFGYEPYSWLLGQSFLTGGYTFLSRFNIDIDNIAISAAQKMTYTTSNPFYCLQIYSGLPDRFFVLLKPPDPSTSSISICPVQ